MRWIGRFVGISTTSESVDIAEFLGFGGRRAGHAGQLVIHAEVVLERHGGQRLVFRLDGRAFLGFQRLVQTFRETPAGHLAAGELVDDDDLAALDDVVLVALEQLVRLQRLVDVVNDRRRSRRRKGSSPFSSPASSSIFSSFSCPPR
jgi:hypothetical protein